MRCKILPLICFTFFGFTQVDAQMSVQNIAHDKIPVNYKGELDDAYKIEDKGGVHIFVASHMQAGNVDSLFVKYFTQSSNNWKEDWQIKDFSNKVAASLYTVTKFADIDGNGVFETLFAYEVAEDFAPGSIMTRKVMLFYKDRKYAIRGQFHEGADDSGTVVMDKDFDTIPFAVKKYTIGYWNELSDFLIIKTIPVPAN
jgi:hypothetical protein